MNEDTILELERQVAELMAWKREREQQQLVFPLDKTSKDIISNDFLSIVGSREYTGGAAGHTFLDFLVKQGSYSGIIGQDTSITFTVNATTDVFTVTKYAVNDDSRCYVQTSDTLPAGLDGGVTYWVINSAGLTFQLSTDGINPVDVTTTGTGLQYLVFF